MSVWIKICASTSVEDALLAAEAGADAVGFVFAPSKRRVTAEQVAAMVPHLPLQVEKIGVFVDAGLEEIARAVETCGLSGVQLHFQPPAGLVAQIRGRFGPDLRIVQTVHFAAGAVPELPGDAEIDAFLIDSRTEKAAGGTGLTFDWGLAASTLFRSGRERKLIAAGGLNPENVAEAIATLRPWGVDVASGVEGAPGRKDPAKVRAFIARVRSAVSSGRSPKTSLGG